ncbi:MAG: hypothetical protein ACJARD_001731 [Alphaproteobacteria bacterium]|jgi:hypothetical protein
MYKKYPPYLKTFARDMRKNPTDAEKKILVDYKKQANRI